MTSGWCGGNCRRGCGDQGGTARFELVRVALVSLILFLSGCTALLFQTLWLRLSGLAFGNSIWSAALIPSSFMAGLALGSAIAARLASGGFDRFALTLDWNRSSPSLAGRWYLDFPCSDNGCVP